MVPGTLHGKKVRQQGGRAGHRRARSPPERFYLLREGRQQTAARTGGEVAGVAQGEGVKWPSSRPETALSPHWRHAASASAAAEGRRRGRARGASAGRVLSGEHAREVGLPVDGAREPSGGPARRGPRRQRRDRGRRGSATQSQGRPTKPALFQRWRSAVTQKRSLLCQLSSRG